MNPFGCLDSRFYNKTIYVCRCSPCGTGTRCMSCTWLVAFCNIKDTNIDDLLPIPYKKPYIEMFEDIKSGIINGDFSAEQVAKFLEDAKMELYKDCKDCYLTPNNISDLQPVAYAVRKGSIKQARKRFF